MLIRRDALSTDRKPLLRQLTIAYAHSGTDSYAYVVFDRDRVTGNVQFPIHELGHALGLHMSTEPESVDVEVATHFDAIAQYASEHFHIGDTSGPWKVRFTGHRSLSRSIGSYAILDYAVDTAVQLPGREFEVSFDGIIESNPDHHASVLVISKRGWWGLKTTDEQRLEFGADETKRTVLLGPDDWSAQLAGTTTFVKDNIKEYWRRARKRLRAGGS